MSTSVKVVGFVAALCAAFGVALAVGNAVGPVGEAVAAGHQTGQHTTPRPAGVEHVPGGLMVSQGGFTFSLTNDEAPAGDDVPVTFTIDDADGVPVTAYDVAHDKRLHLIAVRRDFHGFQHVHPALAADGTWASRLDLDPGQWRLFADFTATGAEPLTLGADLSVAGTITASGPQTESRTDDVDGYRVTVDGELRPGSESRLTLGVSYGGKPVTDLQPYLGAYGHLVVLRDGDLAYLHVHPDGAPGDGSTRPGPDVVFHATIPSSGTYHLYLNFRHRAVVHTAQFTISAGRDGGR